VRASLYIHLGHNTVKTRTMGPTDISVGRRHPPGVGLGRAIRLSRTLHRSVRLHRVFFLILLCGLTLVGCEMPDTTTQLEADPSAKVEAIQTRVAETRAEQAAKDDATAAETDGNQGAVEETEKSDDADSVLVVGPSAEQLELLAKLRPQGDAPELLNEIWLNSEPLKLADLRGKVVLVEFWTYG